MMSEVKFLKKKRYSMPELYWKGFCLPGLCREFLDIGLDFVCF